MTVLNDLKPQWDKLTGLYEEKRAAMLPVLRLCQERFGFISPETEIAVAEYFQTTPVHVREVVSFYEFFRTRAAGKQRIQFCHTLSCAVNGCEPLIQYTKEKLGVCEGQTTSDGRFTLERAECLGACELAPMMKVDKDIYGPLTREKIDEVLGSGLFG